MHGSHTVLTDGPRMGEECVPTPGNSWGTFPFRLLRGIVLMYILGVSFVQCYTISIFPTNTLGGASTSYNVLVVRDPNVQDLTTAAKSLVVIFPTDYSIPNTAYSCTYENAATPCAFFGSNSLSVNLAIPDNTITSFALIISSITNPAIEIGTVSFTADLVRTGSPSIQD